MIGARISDRYKVIEAVGDGGMAIVYKAKDLILDRIVAVKVLRSEFSRDEEFIRRFHREAESATSLNHPNIVDIFDVGEDNGIYFIVMEYVEGKTLKQLIREAGLLSVDKSVLIMGQIASAIAHAHEHHIVHRDIKPHNILLDEDGMVKVTDFGIALAATSATITHTNSVLGSVHYFSPEQARGGIANAKSDIYSMGIVLFEMVTGKLPFSGESPVSIALKHLQDQIPDPKTINPSLPQSIENIILRALAKDPVNRYESVRDFEEDLQTALRSDRLQEPKIIVNNDEEATKIIGPVLPVNQQIQDQSQTIHKGASPKIEKKKRKRRKWPLILLLIFLLLGVAGVSAFTVLPDLFYPNDVEVPDVKGEVYENAWEELKSVGLNVERENRPSEDVEAGTVISQDPRSESTVKEGSTVILIVSEGLEEIEVKSYIGQTKSMVERLDLKSEYQDITWIEEFKESIPEGEIFAQTPEPGDKIIPKEKVLILYYSKGPPPFELNNLIGMTESEINQYSDETGLMINIREEREYHDEIEAGRVIYQFPSEKTEVTEGDNIDVTLSKGKQPQPVKHEVTVNVNVGEEQPNDQVNNDTNEKDKNKNKNKDKEKEQKYLVEIVVTDAENTGEVWKKDEITESKEYVIPLTIAPDGEAAYQIFVDGQPYEEKTTITYEEAKQNEE
jgi:serine/threonine protein kinase